MQKVSSKRKALRAREKPAALGPDLDLKKFLRSSNPWLPCPVSSLPEDIVKQSLGVGVRSDERERAGTYFQIDHSVVFQGVQKMFEGKAEVMNTQEALDKYDWLKDYWWKLVAVDTDKYTAVAELNWDRGCFLRVLEARRLHCPFSLVSSFPRITLTKMFTMLS